MIDYPIAACLLVLSAGIGSCALYLVSKGRNKKIYLVSAALIVFVGAFSAGLGVSDWNPMSMWLSFLPHWALASILMVSSFKLRSIWMKSLVYIGLLLISPVACALTLALISL